MRPLVLPVVLAAANEALARLHSLPDDAYAFPKYNVAFLNSLPLENHTAQRWLAEGLRGGVREFLDQPWEDNHHPPALGNGAEDLSLLSPPDQSDEYKLEHIKMGPRDSYLCLIPKPLEHQPPPPEEESDDEVTPAHSWSLLQPLIGTCLYHRQAWFTYSYCHNEEIRQFRELIQARSLPTGPHRPEEDPEWEAYTLGRAPPTPEPGADLTVAQQNALAANLELARTAGSRYLVQRWGDGTLCDKTQKPREVEVQFHCSMATTDTIVFVKESRTCAYVLVVHTPRLCGVPGFRSSTDSREQASISCREVVPAQPPLGAPSLPNADRPLAKITRRKTVLPPPLPAKDKASAADKGGKYTDAIRRALQALRGNAADIELLEDDDGGFVIQLLDDLPAGAEGEDNLEAAAERGADRIAHFLRDAGIDVQNVQMAAALTGTPKTAAAAKKKKKKNGDEKQEADDAADQRREVNEL